MSGAAGSSCPDRIRGYRATVVASVVVLAALVLVVVVVFVATISPGPGSIGAVGPRQLAAGASTSLSTPPSPRNVPELGAARVVERDDVGDPFILEVPAGAAGNPATRYVLFWTTDWQSNVPTAVSTDLIHWRRIADALPGLPSWAEPSITMTWGPAAVRVAGGWVLYFSTEEATSHRECIGAAFSRSPTGPYVDRSAAPMVCQRTLGGSIDPSVVRTGPDGLSLVWKSDGNAAGVPAGIWEQQLTTDGRSLQGPRRRLLVAGQPWQHGIVEGPAMLAASKGGWWLFYSGGAWQSNTYDTGVAWCVTTAGPCHDVSSGPLLASTPTAVSPGGLDTFVDGRGHVWASYSAFPSQPADARAAMAEDRVLEIAPILSR